MRRIRSLIVSVAVAAATVAATASPATAAGVLKADYQFQNVFTSSVAGAPALVPEGSPGSFAFEPQFGQQVYSWPFQSGLALPTLSSILTNGTGRYSIAIIFKLGDMSGYRKIIDLKSLVDDSGQYYLNGVLDFYPVAAGSAQAQADVYRQVVVTRDAGGTYTGYLNGAQQFSFDDSATQYGIVDANDTLHFFDDDSATGGNEASAGAVSRLRVWDDALTAQEVAALGGPTVVVLKRFAAVRTPGGVVLGWRTGSEAQIAGFNVFREQRGRLVRVNRSPIPTSFGGLTRGSSYRLVDRASHGAGVYRLQGVGLDGSRTWLGIARTTA